MDGDLNTHPTEPSGEFARATITERTGGLRLRRGKTARPLSQDGDEGTRYQQAVGLGSASPGLTASSHEISHNSGDDSDHKSHARPLAKQWEMAIQDDASAAWTEQSYLEEELYKLRVLPSHIHDISETHRSSLPTWLVISCDRLTYYEQLCTASTQGWMAETLRVNLVAEWKYAGNCLIAIAAANAAAYGFSQNETSFAINELALRFLVISAVFSALGLIVDADLLLQYSHADAQRFMKLARGRYLGYLFFSLHSRVPLFTFCAALLNFSLFLLAVAYTAWPTPVMVLSVVALALYCVQYIIWILEQIIHGAVRTKIVFLSLVRGGWKYVKAVALHPCISKRSGVAAG